MTILLLLIFIFLLQNINIKAVTSNEYPVFFDYVSYKIIDGLTTINNQGNNLKSTYVEDAKNNVGKLEVYLLSSKNYSNKELQNNGYICLTEFTIKINTIYETVNIELVDQYNNPYCSSNSKELEVTDLIDQKYKCTITCTDSFYNELKNDIQENTVIINFTFTVDTIKPKCYVYDKLGDLINHTDTNAKFFMAYGIDSDSGVKEIYMTYETQPKVLYTPGTRIYETGTYRFWVVDNAGNHSEDIFTFMDHDIPKIVIDNAFFYTDANTDFTVKLEDVSIVYLYYKLPNSNTYVKSSNKTININNTMPKGKYYFYAIDIYKNKTEEFWINYIGTKDLVTINNVDNSNAVYLTWNENLTVKVNNSLYQQGTIISEEGSYEVEIKQKNGNITNMQFEIECYYELKETVEATCQNPGYTIWECASCKKTEKRDESNQTNHVFESLYIPPKCEEKGGTYNYCIYCGENYYSNILAPKGHDYVYEIINPTCYNNGVRKISCNNCEYYEESIIETTGHNKFFLEYIQEENKTILVYMCGNCMEIIEEVEDNTQKEVFNLMAFMKDAYFQYVIWFLLVSVGIWSLIIGIRFIFLKTKKEVVKTKSIIKNYILGIIAIFVLLIIIPLIIEGIASII